MRRGLVCSVLIAGSLVLPTYAAPARPTPPPAVRQHVPGRYAVSPGATARDRYDQLVDALAGGGPFAAEVMRRHDAALKSGVVFPSGPYVVTFPFPASDLNGDRYPDVYVYRTTYDYDGEEEVGSSEVWAYDGKNGRKLWHVFLDDAPWSYPYTVDVGGGPGEPGVVLVYMHINWTTYFISLRFFAIGERGQKVYDRTVDEADGHGRVQWGGWFDGVLGGGTDTLISRVERYQVGSGPTHFNPQGFDWTQSFVLDGRNGALLALTDRTLGYGGYPAFVATGDIDNDRREDYLLIRQGLQDLGSVTARSTVESKAIWTASDVPVGMYFFTRPPYAMDYAGDKHRDVLYGTGMPDYRLLSIPGVTDLIPLLDPGPPGEYAVLLDGATGVLRWTRVDNQYGSYWPIGDINHDHKVDIMGGLVLSDSHRGGVRFVALTGANKKLYTRDITVPRDLPGPFEVGWSAYSAGDVDRDHVDDLWYGVAAGNGVLYHDTAGFLHVRTGTILTSADYPLGGSVDGRGDDRYSYASPSKSVVRMVARDGAAGTAYWTMTVSYEGTDAIFAGLAGMPGARGRCADVMVVVSGPKWLYTGVADGRTGVLKWGRSLQGTVPDSLRVASNRKAVRCG